MASDAVSANTVARSYSDTVINTVKNDTMLNANIYDINQYIENIKKKYTIFSFLSLTKIFFLIY